MQVKARWFLGSLFTATLILGACGASPAVVADESKGRSDKQARASITDTVGSVVASFIRADLEKKYSMMSNHYRSVFRNADDLRSAFSKEWYGVSRIEDSEAVKDRRGRQLIHVRVVLEWRFEGYEGTQTCHFNLLQEAEGWRVDWFLC